MPSVAVISDTDASLTVELAERHGIRLVPISVHFGQESLRSGIDIDDAGLFARVDREGKLPTTSAPAPGEFHDAFEVAFASGAHDVICICVSSELSAVFQAASAARALLPGRNIHVIDSRTVSMPQGFMAIAAAEAAQAGSSAEQAVAQALAIRERTHFYGALATLKYLAMSGRVGHLAAGFGNLLNVKPILTVIDGKLEMLERIRSRGKSLSRLEELTRNALGGRAAERLAVVHVNAYAEALSFADRLRRATDYSGELVVAELTPGLSVHTGAGMIGVTVVG